MEPKQLIDFLGLIEKLKCNTRHSWTSSGRQESVAEHSWRLAVMAMLVADEFPKLDIEKVLKMCLIHDFGEAITGDIPAFYKTENDEEKEEQAIADILKLLPNSIASDLGGLFSEMGTLDTEEAKLVKALDKIEVLISHNEASLDTWIPREHTLNLNYGDEYVTFSDYLTELRGEIRKNSIQKIEDKK